jgi:molybdate-binding protein
VNVIRRRLQGLLKATDRPEWKAESRGRLFAHAYKDKEFALTSEEEKKMAVSRTRDSIPFGMNIRKAAHTATFGSRPGALQRYTFVAEKKVVNSNPFDDLDELLDESDSDSVSQSSSDDGS